MFPFHSRLHQNKHNILSIVLYVVGILIPVPGVIGTFLDGGYSIVQFPPIICGAQNPAVFYYSTVFTINILGIVAMDMLIIIVWTVRLVSNEQNISLHIIVCGISGLYNTLQCKLFGLDTASILSFELWPRAITYSPVCLLIAGDFFLNCGVIIVKDLHTLLPP